MIVGNFGSERYEIQYLLPEDISPWPNALVYGSADSLEEAKKYILVAMSRCGGWSGNEELARLMLAHGLATEGKGL